MFTSHLVPAVRFKSQSPAISPYLRIAKSLRTGGELPIAVTRKVPHLRGCIPLQLPVGVDVRRLLRGQLAVSVHSAEGEAIDATGAVCELASSLQDASKWLAGN